MLFQQLIGNSSVGKFGGPLQRPTLLQGTTVELWSLTPVIPRDPWQGDRVRDRGALGGNVGELWGAPWRSWEGPGRILGGAWAVLRGPGGILGSLGGSLGIPGGSFENPWKVLRAPWGYLWVSGTSMGNTWANWGRLGGFLGDPWKVLWGPWVLPGRFESDCKDLSFCILSLGAVLNDNQSALGGPGAALEWS